MNLFLILVTYGDAWNWLHAFTDGGPAVFLSRSSAERFIEIIRVDDENHEYQIVELDVHVP